MENLRNKNPTDTFQKFSCTKINILKIIFILFEKERQTQRPSIQWFTPQTPAIATAETGGNQEPEHLNYYLLALRQ